VGLFLVSLFSIPVIHMSVFVPIPCCLDHCSFLVVSEVWEDYASSFVLFHKDCFGNSGSHVSLGLFVLVL